MLAGASVTAHAERIKDLATVSGVRTNQLVGYGLVVGLDGTGDQTSQAPFTIQSITNMLARFGVPDSARAQPAAEERGRGDGHSGSAGLLQGRPDDRRHSGAPSATPRACGAAAFS